MLTALTTLLLTAALLGAGLGALIHRLGATMPERPDTGAVLLGKILAALGQASAVTAALALLHTGRAPSGPLAWLTVLAALAVTASLTTGRRIAPAGRHRATTTIVPTGATP